MSITNNRTVLLVDDDMDFLEQHKVFLESDGFEVVCARSRTEAEALLDNCNWSLGVFDLMMDNADDGFVLCYQFKRRYPNTPVIIVSAVQSETGIEFDAHNNDWIKADVMLQKPIRFEQLRREIRRLCKTV